MMIKFYKDLDGTIIRVHIAPQGKLELQVLENLETMGLYRHVESFDDMRLMAEEGKPVMDIRSPEAQSYLKELEAWYKDRVRRLKRRKRMRESSKSSGREGK